MERNQNTETKYRRLPGKGLRREGFISIARTYCTLWLAQDHILNVDNHVFSEDYKRFYFRDIQAIITKKTNRGKVWNIILSILVGIFLFIAFRSEWPEAMILWMIVAGIFGLILFINWLWGPTCTCHIITAVQQEVLPSLDRLKKAEKVINILRRLIQEAQGEFNVEEAQANFSSARTETSGHTLYFNSPVRTGQPVKHYHGRIHEIVFFLLLVNGLLTGIYLLYHNIPFNILNWGITLVLSICVIIALVKQYESDMTKEIKRLTWSTLGYVCLFYIIGYVFFMFSFMKNALQAGNTYGMENRWEMYRAALKFSPYDSLVFLGVYLFLLGCAFLLGSIGIMFLRRFRREYMIPPPLTE